MHAQQLPRAGDHVCPSSTEQELVAAEEEFSAITDKIPQRPVGARPPLGEQMLEQRQICTHACQRQMSVRAGKASLH